MHDSTDTSAIQLANNIMRCPAVTSYNLTTASNSVSTRSTLEYTINIPEMVTERYSLPQLMRTYGAVYLMNSTNETTFCLSSMATSDYKTSFVNRTAKSYQTAYLFGHINTLTNIVSSNCGLFNVTFSAGYAQNMTTCQVPKYDNGFQLLVQDSSWNICNIYDCRYNRNGQQSVTILHPIYFDIADPSKLTVIIPPPNPFGISPASSTFTMYRATLSQTTT